MQDLRFAGFTKSHLECKEAREAEKVDQAGRPVEFNFPGDRKHLEPMQHDLKRAEVVGNQSCEKRGNIKK